MSSKVSTYRAYSIKYQAKAKQVPNTTTTDLTYETNTCDFSIQHQMWIGNRDEYLRL